MGQSLARFTLGKVNGMHLSLLWHKGALQEHAALFHTQILGTGHF
jgi:hypothetical protein